MVRSNMICSLCPLYGKKKVEGEGDLKSAELVIIGEAPGEEEERQGRPFVGYSGRILRGVLFEVLGINGSLYITNVVKCRPPGNQLTKEMVKCCKGFLEGELALCKKAKLFLALGATAKDFFGIPGSVVDVRGKIYETKFGRVMVTWHPAYRQLLDKDQVAGNSPFQQFVKDVKRAWNYVKTGKIYQRVDYRVVKSSKDVEEFLREIVDNIVSIDFETSGVRIWDKDFQVITAGVSVNRGNTWVLDSRDLGEVFSFVVENIWKVAKKVVVFNAGFDVCVGVKNYGWDLYDKWRDLEDVQVMWYLLAGDVTNRSLKDLVIDFLDIGQYGIDWKKVDIKELPKERLYEYNAIDAYATLKLYEDFLKRLKEAGLEWEEIYGRRRMSLYDAYEVVLKKLLALSIELQLNGMYVDVEYLLKLREELKEKKRRFLEKVRGVNLNSPQQVLKWLRSVGLDIDSTRREVLEKIAVKGDLSDEARERLESLLEYRTIEKLLNTYVDALLTKWIDSSSYVHAKYSVVETATGRVASSEPNLMNIPTRSGSMIEKAFVSRFGEDGRIIKADFSQHELRVACQYSKDIRMKEFFESGVDIHMKVAMELYGMRRDESEELKKELRRRAKGFNFGVIYGRGYKSIAEELGMSEEEAKDTVKRYFEMFLGLSEWLEKVKGFAKRNGYVRTMFGRYRRINVGSDERWVQKAVNTPVQSAASDIAGCFVWDLVLRLRGEGLKAKVVNFIHDAVLLDCLVGEVELVKDIISEGVGKIELPDEKFIDFEVEIAVGKSWGECKEE
jgi:DNA polymerase-1